MISKEEYIEFAENGFTYYATEILEKKEFIGMIGLASQTYKSKFSSVHLPFQVFVFPLWELTPTSD